MGKFSKYSTTVQKPKAPWKIHPIWQGIGCVMMVIIPLVSYAGSVMLIEANNKNNWFPFPREFYGPASNPYLYAEIGVTVLFSMFGYLVFVILYTIMYRLWGPPRYGPTDAPPPKRTKGKRTKGR
jgi:hypothetical protein